MSRKSRASRAEALEKIRSDAIAHSMEWKRRGYSDIISADTGSCLACGTVTADIDLHDQFCPAKEQS